MASGIGADTDECIEPVTLRNRPVLLGRVADTVQKQVLTRFLPMKLQGVPVIIPLDSADGIFQVDTQHFGPASCVRYRTCTDHRCKDPWREAAHGELLRGTPFGEDWLQVRLEDRPAYEVEESAMKEFGGSRF